LTAGFAADLAAVALSAAGLAASDLPALGLGADVFAAAGLLAPAFAPLDLAAAGLEPAVCVVVAGFGGSVVPAAPACRAGTETPISSARPARHAVRRIAGVGSSRVTLFPRRESNFRRHSHDLFD
jgi:hypothetical protein